MSTEVEYNSFTPYREPIAHIETLELASKPFVHLRTVKPDHAEQFSAFIEQEADHLTEYLPWAFDSVSATERIEVYIREVQAYKRIAFFIFEGTTDDPGELIGFVGLASPEYHSILNRSAKLGVYIAKRAQGQGLAYRSVQALLDYAEHTSRLTKVILEIGETNTRSRALAAKLGATCLGKISPIKINPHNKRRIDAMHYRDSALDPELIDTLYGLYDGQEPRNIPMEKWELDVQTISEQRKAFQEGCIYTYLSAAGLIHVQGFTESSFYKEISKDLQTCSQASLGSNFFTHRQCLPLIPAIQNAVRKRATINLSVFPDYARYEETQAMKAELEAATNIKIESSIFNKVLALIDEQIIWNRDDNGRYRRFTLEKTLATYAVESPKVIVSSLR